MSDDNYIIRPITEDDNTSVNQMIASVFIELGLPLVGTAYADEETKKMFESYQGENELYLVVEKNNEIFGGAGIKPLRDFESDVCELQKMYFSNAIRGKGLGREMLSKCLDSAKAFGFKTCYLETIPTLESAIHLYESAGFTYIDKPLGNTGHYSCEIHMIKSL